MATAAECGQDYQDCGFAALRTEAKGLIKPLPENGCCGIPIESCGRKKLKQGHKLFVVGDGTKTLKDKSLIFENEIKVAVNLPLT